MRSSKYLRLYSHFFRCKGKDWSGPSLNQAIGQSWAGLGSAEPPQRIERREGTANGGRHRHRRSTGWRQYPSIRILVSVSLGYTWLGLPWDRFNEPPLRQAACEHVQRKWQRQPASREENGMENGNSNRNTHNYGEMRAHRKEVAFNPCPPSGPYAAIPTEVD